MSFKMELFSLVDLLYNIYFYMIIIYVFMSWVPGLQQSKVGELLARFVEPYLAIFRRFIPLIGMIDISPIIALFALQFLRYGIITIISLIL